MRIAILGYGDQGRAAYEYWGTKDNEITICDVNPNLNIPEGVNKHLGTDYLENLTEFDLLIRTPILHPREILATNPQSPDILSRVTTVTNEFMRVCPTRNIIGVTGTKGKGTTSTLITKMLEATGKKVHLGGNIGIPPLDMLKNDIQPDDWVVLELANFQLIDLKTSPHIAVCLMVAPEHLDWHPDFEEYIKAKQQLFANQRPDDIAIYYAKNEHSKHIIVISPGKKIPYYEPPGAYIANDAVLIDGQEICKTDGIQLLGKHNWQNVCAAITTVWQVSNDKKAIPATLRSFTGLPHRLELVREVGGVKYYDDSFGTTPETAIVAIEAFNQPKVLILGGSDKAGKYDGLAQTIASSNVRAAVVVGDTGPAIAASLRGAGFEDIHEGGTNMTEIINKASGLAKPGDVILLSTGCASFGLFKNYKDRGEQFKATVQALA